MHAASSLWYLQQESHKISAMMMVMIVIMVTMMVMVTMMMMVVTGDGVPL